MSETFTMIDEWLEDKRLNWTDKCLLAKIYALTKHGTQLFTSNNLNSFFKSMYFTDNELRGSYERLTKYNYICKTVDKINGNISTVKYVQLSERQQDFKIDNRDINFDKNTAKALSERELHNATIENGIKQLSTVAKDNSRALHNATSEPCIKQFSSLDRNIDRNNRKKESETLSTLDDCFEEFAPIVENTQDYSGNHVSTIVETTPPLSLKPRKPYSENHDSSIYLSKNLSRNLRESTLSNTHSYDEVFSMFTLNAKELSKSYPSLLALDLKLIAMKYFNYREEQKWKGVKDLSLNVSNWLIDEIKHLQTTPTQTTKKGDFFGNLNKLAQMNSPEVLDVPQGEKIIDVDASIVTD